MAKTPKVVSVNSKPNHESHEMHLHFHSANDQHPLGEHGNPIPESDVGMYKASSAPVPLHDILHGMGEHDLAEKCKKHMPKTKMHLGSMSMNKTKRKGGY